MVTPDGVFSEACGLPNSDIPGHDKPSLCKVRIISTSLAHVGVCMSSIHGKAVSLHTYPPSNGMLMIFRVFFRFVFLPINL